MAVNVDGVVLGVRRLAQVMPAGGRIVATASLAGLTAMPDDPVYAATKHAVVGFVRSVAPTLERAGSRSTRSAPGSPTRRCSAARSASGSTPPGSRSAHRGRGRGRGLARARVRADRARLGRPAGPAAARLPLPERPRRRRTARGAVVGRLPPLARRADVARRGRASRTARDRRRRSSSGSAGRRPSGAPRPARRRSGPPRACIAICASGVSSVRPRAPCTWIARSITSFSTPAA